MRDVLSGIMKLHVNANATGQYGCFDRLPGIQLIQLRLSYQRHNATLASRREKQQSVTKNGRHFG